MRLQAQGRFVPGAVVHRRRLRRVRRLSVLALEAFLSSDLTEQPEKENGNETTSQELTSFKETVLIRDTLTVPSPVQESSTWMGLESNRRVLT